MITTVLFDKDGTLLNLDKMWFDWAQNIFLYLEQHVPHIALQKEPFLTRLGAHPQAESILPQSAIASASEQEMQTIIAYLIHTTGIAWDEAIISASNAVNYANSHELATSIIALPHVKTFLETLHSKHILCGVLTADTTPRAITHIQALDLQPYFQFIYGSDVVTHSKPAPDLIEHALAHYSFDLTKTAFIGDSDVDMQMAKTAGCAVTIGIGNTLNPQLTDIQIAGYQELLHHPIFHQMNTTEN